MLDAAPRKTNRDRLGRAGRRMGVDRSAVGVHPDWLHRPGAAVAAALDDGAGRGRPARVRRAGWPPTPPRWPASPTFAAAISRPTNCTSPARPSARGGTLTKTSLAEHLGGLRTCFERLTEWDGDDVPAAVLVFDGDLPLRDAPLPRFLDDGAFTKLLQATRADPDPFVRLAVEFLARTGLRKGEFLDLTVDSVVQIGAAYWLHVPLGKLRTDRYIPLHPQLKDLLDAWLAGRPASLRTPYLFIEHGQRDRPGPRRPGRRQSRPVRRHRTRQPAPAPSHAGDPGHQPGHEPRGDSRPVWGIDRCA